MVLYHIILSANSTEEETKVVPLAKKTGASSTKKRKMPEEQKQLALTSPKVHTEGHARPSSCKDLNSIEDIRKALSYVCEVQGKSISEYKALQKKCEVMVCSMHVRWD